MASWYDYIPIVGSLSRIGSGDYSGALYHQLDPANIGGWLKDKTVGAIDHAMDKQSEGYQQAKNMLGSMASNNWRLQMEGLDKAEGYMDPANERLNALYGAPGSFRK